MDEKAFFSVSYNQRSDINAKEAINMDRTILAEIGEHMKHESDIDDIFYVNNGHSFIDGKLLLSNHYGVWGNFVDTYMPGASYTVDEGKCTTMYITLSSDIMYAEKPWMACYLGARIAETNPLLNKPNNGDTGLFISICSDKKARIYTGNTKIWPNEEGVIDIDFDLVEEKVIAVSDYGDHIDYALVKDDKKIIFARANVLPDGFNVEDGRGNICFTTGKNLPLGKYYHFLVFNHIVKTEISSVNVVTVDNDGNEMRIYTSNFNKKMSKEKYRIYQFSSNVKNFLLNNEIRSFSSGQFIMVSELDLYSNTRRFPLKLSLKFNKAYLLKYFTEETTARLLECFTHNEATLDAKLLAYTDELVRKFKQDPKQDSANYLYLAELLTILSGNSQKNKNNVRYDSRIERIATYIESHCAEIKTIDEIAETFYISKYHLSRLFHKSTGMTLIDFLNHAKIAQACSALNDNPKISMSNLGMLCGFNSTQYFCNVFKSVTGETPKQYAKSHISI